MTVPSVFATSCGIPEFWPGLCECGCGEVTSLATRTRKDNGYVKGESLRFVIGHRARGQKRSVETRRKVAEANRGKKRTAEQKLLMSERRKGKRRGELSPVWKGTAASYSAIHSHLARWFTKTGVCEECGRTTRTEWAFLKHPQPHTRSRTDYRELCRPCHTTLDSPSRREALLLTRIAELEKGTT